MNILVNVSTIHGPRFGAKNVTTFSAVSYTRAAVFCWSLQRSSFGLRFYSKCTLPSLHSCSGFENLSKGSLEFRCIPEFSQFFQQITFAVCLFTFKIFASTVSNSIIWQLATRQFIRSRFMTGRKFNCSFHFHNLVFSGDFSKFTWFSQVFSKIVVFLPVLEWFFTFS